MSEVRDFFYPFPLTIRSIGDEFREAGHVQSEAYAEQTPSATRGERAFRIAVYDWEGLRV